jgi:hypothetical protein
MAVSTIDSSSLNATSDLVINFLTVGKGGGSVATNTVVGFQAGQSNTTGANTTIVGYQAGKSLTGNYNTIIGANTAANAGAATDNTIIGYSAGANLTTGSGNTLLGDNAGAFLTTPNANTFIGGGIVGSTGGAGFYVTTGAKNTIIGGYNGNQGGLDIRTTSNNVVLSDGDGNIKYAYESNSNTTKMPDVYTNTSGTAANVVILSSGTICRSTSSLKYKRDVQNATHGLAKVLQLRPVTYKGKSEKDGDTVFGGLIAEEVHDAGLTEFVQYAEDGSPDALNYGNMVSLAFKAIQELKTIVDAQAAEIAKLKAKVA